MPLPLLPAILLGSSAAAAAKGVFDAAISGNKLRKLQQEYDNRRIQYEYAESYYLKHRSRLEDRLGELGQLRLSALVALGEAVAFLKKARIRERHVFEDVHLSQEQLTEWEGVSLQAANILQGIFSSSSVGIATATGAYGLVGTVGVASTGTAISTLSGAAATNATLAWFGGGALAAGGGGIALGSFVLGGLVAGPALLAGGFFLSRKLEKVKTEVARLFSEMDIAESQMNHQLAEFHIIGTRISELEHAVGYLEANLRTTLLNSDHDNIEDVFTVAKLAKTLAAINSERETILTYFNHRFSERKAALDQLFLALNEGVASKSTIVIDASLTSIINILQDNPLKDLNEFRRNMERPDFMIEL